jgi:hypothetical protein
MKFYLRSDGNRKFKFEKIIHFWGTSLVNFGIHAFSLFDAAFMKQHHQQHKVYTHIKNQSAHTISFALHYPISNTNDLLA